MNIFNVNLPFDSEYYVKVVKFLLMLLSYILIIELSIVILEKLNHIYFISWLQQEVLSDIWPDCLGLSEYTVAFTLICISKPP